MSEGEAIPHEPVACPFCDSTETEMIALFGMQMMTTQHYCRNCRSAFEAIKWDSPRTRDDKPEHE